jgi:DNA adenine methylase
MNESPTRPIVRYHGGKWKLAPWIIDRLPPHRGYVEPFGGGASVLLRKVRSYAEVYNDLDSHIVNLFRVARDHGENLRRLLELTPFARDEFALSYEPTEDSLELARRTVVRSFMGFGSNAHNRRTGFRSNSNRSGTTPAQDWRHYPDALAVIIDRLRGVVIERRDAVDVLIAHDGPDVLHYVDPPYVLSTRDKGVDYGHEMNDQDHRRLAAVLRGLRGMVALSGYRSELYEELFVDWHREEANSRADKARPRIEVLWMNEACANRQRQLRLAHS